MHGCAGRGCTQATRQSLNADRIVAFAVLRETDRTYLTLNPKGSPRSEGVDSIALGGLRDAGFDAMAMLWVLNLSDGHHRLLDIAERPGYSFRRRAADGRVLVEHGLLEELATT
jgi:aminopeptidase-like protein